VTESQTPVVEPVDVDGVGAVAVGTVLWGVALVVTLLLRPALDAAGNGWWVAVCACGTALGLLGLWFVRRRRDRMSHAR